MIVVDSCGWLEYLADGPLAQDYAPFLAEEGNILTPAVVFYEVVKKVWRERGYEKALVVAAHMQKTRVVPLDADLGLAAAGVSLRWGLPMADAIVYATAVSHGCRVVTSDRHFDGLPEVVFIPATG